MRLASTEWSLWNLKSGALQETSEMWPRSAGEASAEHVIQPDSPAILPAGAYMLSAWPGMHQCIPLLAAFVFVALSIVCIGTACLAAVA